MEDAPSILVIDDSQVLRKIIEICLQREGYRVTSFADPVVALRDLFVTQTVALPDLFIVDIGLPHLDGYDVIKRLRKKHKQTPIIAISGRDGVLDRLKARLAGANVYLTKPFRTQELVALVQQLLSQRDG